MNYGKGTVWSAEFTKQTAGSMKCLTDCDTSATVGKNRLEDLKKVTGNVPEIRMDLCPEKLRHCNQRQLLLLFVTTATK
jgi:hypothetical protein